MSVPPREEMRYISPFMCASVIVTNISHKLRARARARKRKRSLMDTYIHARGVITEAHNALL